MSEAHAAVDGALKEVETLQRFLRKRTSPQVRSTEETSVIKAVCLTWFNNHREDLAACLGDDLLAEVDDAYKAILSGTDRATSRKKYKDTLKSLKTGLSSLRGYAVTSVLETAAPTTDAPPSFSSLVADPAMQEVLKRRWHECAKCVDAGAPLAAIVMMGGLLEALLLARVHRESNKKPIFAAKTAPKDRNTQKPLQLQEWTLRNYIDVAHELGWITPSAKDVGEVVRDYRNYIHPQKELSHGVVLKDGDARLLWEIAKSISKQLLAK